MALINERHVIADRAGDAKGGGNYATLMDFLNRRRVALQNFVDTTISVSSAQFILIDSSMVTGTLAVGTATQETDGGTMAAELAGSVGTAATTNITDGLGNVLNMVEVRDATSHDPIKDTGNRKVYALFQSENGVADGTAIGAAASENCQISFCVIDSSGALALTTVNGDIEISTPKVYAERHLPTIYKDGNYVDAEVLDPATIAPKIRSFLVTAKFAANEVITISTGAGTTGTSTPSGDTIASIGASAGDFNTITTTQVWLNGARARKSAEAIYDSATTFHFSVKLDVADWFQVEVKGA